MAGVGNLPRGCATGTGGSRRGPRGGAGSAGRGQAAGGDGVAELARGRTGGDLAADDDAVGPLMHKWQARVVIDGEAAATVKHADRDMTWDLALAVARKALA